MGAPRAPGAVGPSSFPSTWSAAPGVCSQRSWKMLLRWKGFHGHCQDSGRRARPPRLTCSSPTPQLPGSWGACPREGSRRGNRPIRGLGYPCLDASARVPAGGSGGAPRGGPLGFPPRPGPELTCAAPGAAADAIRSCKGCSGRHRAVRAVRGAGCPWPALPRAAPRRRTATRGDGGPSRSVSARPRAVPPAEDPPLARPAPAAARDPRSALLRPPGAARPLRPAEWRGLLAAGAAQGRREAGSARISINLGPRRELRQPPPRRQPPGPSSELTPEGPRANPRLRN